MLKTVLILLLIPLKGFSQSQFALREDYSFPLTDGGVTRLHQSNDTLYELKCYIDQDCQPKPESHYKILSANKKGTFVIFKLEQLDRVQLSPNPFPEKRFRILALKIAVDKELGYLPLNLGLTKQQIDTIKIDVSSLNDKFFFSFFNETRMKEFTALKKLTTENEVHEIITFIKTDFFKPLLENYAKTETRDLYAAGLSAEILNRACIAKGYNPLGAGVIINALMKR